jgi:predicted DNA-binding transcriptional regulator AlpA
MFCRVFVVIALIITAAALVLTAAMPPADHIGAVITAAAILGVRADRVIRLHELPAFLGVRRSQINEAIKKGLLHPRPAYPGARAQVVGESEVVALQQQAAAEAAAKAAAGEKPIEIAPNRARKRVARKAADEGAVA